jgi:hypothetical protein
VKHAEAVTPHSQEHDPTQLRRRLAVMQSLALRAQGSTVKTDMARAASTQRCYTPFFARSGNRYGPENIFARGLRGRHNQWRVVLFGQITTRWIGRSVVGPAGIYAHAP